MYVRRLSKGATQMAVSVTLYILGLTNNESNNLRGLLSTIPSYNIIYQFCVTFEKFMIYNSVGNKMANSKKQRTNQ